MTVSKFFMPSTNLIGPGALDEGVDQIVRLGFKNALIVTDADLAKMGMAQTLVDKLKHQGIEAAVFDSAQPNPTVSNVNDGLEMLKQHSSDFVISLGGGSSHDCAKAIALVAPMAAKLKIMKGLTSLPNRRYLWCRSIQRQALPLR